MLKRIILDERGRIMPWTLVVLSVGSLLIPPLLGHISTSLLACRTVEEGLREQYAADSGVEYALLQLQNGVTAGQDSYGLNGRAVHVTWGEYITDTYKITSTASSASGDSTTIESYVSLEVVDSPPLPENPPLSSTDGTSQPSGEASSSAASDSPTVRVHIRTYHIYP